MIGPRALHFEPYAEPVETAINDMKKGNIHINFFLHELPFSKTKINLAIRHSHNGLVTITKIKIYLRLFFQGVVFDFLSAYQIHFQLFFEVKKRGKFPNAYSISNKQSSESPPINQKKQLSISQSMGSCFCVYIKYKDLLRSFQIPKMISKEYFFTFP